MQFSTNYLSVDLGVKRLLFGVLRIRVHLDVQLDVHLVLPGLLLHLQLHVDELLLLALPGLQLRLGGELLLGRRGL